MEQSVGFGAAKRVDHNGKDILVSVKRQALKALAAPRKEEGRSILRPYSEK